MRVLFCLAFGEKECVCVRVLGASSDTPPRARAHSLVVLALPRPLLPYRRRFPIIAATGILLPGRHIGPLPCPRCVWHQPGLRSVPSVCSTWVVQGGHARIDVQGTVVVPLCGLERGQRARRDRGRRREGSTDGVAEQGRRARARGLGASHGSHEEHSRCTVHKGLGIRGDERKSPHAI